MKSLDLDFLQLKQKQTIHTHTSQPSSTNTNILHSSYGRGTSKQTFHNENKKRLSLLPYPALSKNINTDDV